MCVQACACSAAICTLQQLDPATMLRLCPALFVKEPSGCLSRIHKAVQPSTLKHTPVAPETKEKQCRWYIGVNSRLRETFFKDIEWSEDDMDDVKLLDMIRNRAMRHVPVSVGFTLFLRELLFVFRTPIDVNMETRVFLINSLKDYPPDSSHSKVSTVSDGLRVPSVISTCLTIIQILLADLEGHNNSTLRRCAYNAVTSLLKRIHQMVEDDNLNAVENFIESGLRFEDRGVRLTAG